MMHVEKDRLAPTLLIAALGLVFSQFSTIPAAAFSYCTEPNEPYCIRAFNTFEDQFSFDMCRGELDRYQSDVEQFNECKADEIKKASQEASDAIAKFNDAIAYWNCKAGGGVIC